METGVLSSKSSKYHANLQKKPENLAVFWQMRGAPGDNKFLMNF